MSEDGLCESSKAKHASELLDYAHHMYGMQKGCDIYLVVEGSVQFDLHKMVLAAFSLHFRKVIEEGCLQGSKYFIPNVTKETLGALVRFMYTGDLTINKSNVYTLLAAAAQLQVTQATEILKKYHQEFEGMPSVADLFLSSQQLNEIAVPVIEDQVSASTDIPEEKSQKESKPSVNNPEDLVIQETYPRTRGKAKRLKQATKESAVPSRRVKRKNSKKLKQKTPDSVTIKEEITEQDYGDDQIVGDDDDPPWEPGAEVEEEGEDVLAARAVSERSLPTRKPGRRGRKPKAQKAISSRECTNDKLPHKGRGRKKKVIENPAAEEAMQEQKEMVVEKKARGRPKKEEAKSTPKAKDREKKFPCNHCEECFVHFSALGMHKRIHLNEGKRHITKFSFAERAFDQQEKISMWKCCKKLDKRQKAKLKEGLKIKCEKCDQMFKYYWEFHKHYIQNHYFKLKCHYCRKRFKTVKLLKFHHLRHHKSKYQSTSKSIVTPNVKTCKVCGKVFLHKSNLSKHVELVHHTDTPESLPRQYALACRHCGRCYKYKAALEAHLGHHGLTPQEILVDLTKPGLLPARGNIYPGKRGDLKNNVSETVTCEHCCRKFSSLHTLNLHMLQKHDQPLYTPKAVANASSTKWRCPENDCVFEGRTSTMLSQHIRENHPHINFSCPKCKYKTPIRSLYDKHLQTRHDTESNKGKKCPKCDEKFKTNYYVRVHLYYKHKFLHPSLKVHRCPVEGCDYFAFQRYIVDLHMSKHSKAKMFECHICSKKLKKEKNVQKHIDKVHKRIRPYICEQCGASYAEESELKTHVARHTKSKLFCCSQCSYSTTDKGNYHSHMWCKHKVQMTDKMKIYRCDQCDYTCDRITRFQEHMIMHKGERNFICQTCGKGFLKKNTLRGHILWVHKERTVRCDYCDHVTSTVANLREHVRIMHTHRNIKPYKCGYCDYLCLTAGNCRKHVAVRHKDLPIKVVKVCEKFPNNSRPVLGAERARNPHRPQTMASFEYEVDALINSADEVKYTEDRTAELPELDNTVEQVAVLDSSLMTTVSTHNMVADMSAVVSQHQHQHHQQQQQQQQHQQMFVVSSQTIEVPQSVASHEMVPDLQPTSQSLQNLVTAHQTHTPTHHQATMALQPAPAATGEHKQGQLLSAPMQVLPSMYSLSSAANLPPLPPQPTEYQLYNLVSQTGQPHGHGVL